MKVVVLSLAAASACALMLGAAARRPSPRDRFLKDLDSLAASVHALAVPPLTQASLAARFATARDRYKRVEAIVAMSFPGSAEGINGPPIERIEDGLASEVVRPEGFQLIEQLVFTDGAADTAAIARETAILAADVKRVRAMAATLSFSPPLLFEAAREELMRIATRGLSNADSPVARRGDAEALAAVDGVIALVEPFGTLRPTRPVTLSSLVELSRALETLRASRGVARFSVGRTLWRDEALTLFDSNAFDASALAPAENRTPSAARVALGRQLFFEPALSGDGTRSCATCHQPEHAFADARAGSPAIGRGMLARNAPSLINAALQPGLFHDLRTAHLEDQAAQVIENPAEMGGNLDTIATRLSGSADYVRRFVESFPSGTRPIDRDRIRLALAAYVRSLVALNAPLDRYLRGDSTALTAEARRGLALFTGKARCASCHNLPLTSGAVPPAYTEMESEGLGVPSMDGRHRDADPGVAMRTKFSADSFHFRTPSLRNVALTAPYMHNGSLRTLGDVIDFYNTGGGTGRGYSSAHQTLPSDSLHLTRGERTDLIAFLESLTDTTGLTARPPRRR